jgi:hypothetical protein
LSNFTMIHFYDQSLIIYDLLLIIFIGKNLRLLLPPAGVV